VYETHVDGRLIAELSDEELKKAIGQICLQIKTGISVLSAAVQDFGVIGILNPERSIKANKAKAEAALRMLDDSLKNYVMEATIRGISISENLQQAYGRSAQLNHNMFLMGSLSEVVS